MVWNDLNPICVSTCHQFFYFFIFIFFVLNLERNRYEQESLNVKFDKTMYNRMAIEAPTS